MEEKINHLLYESDRNIQMAHNRLDERSKEIHMKQKSMPSITEDYDGYKKKINEINILNRQWSQTFKARSIVHDELHRRRMEKCESMKARLDKMDDDVQQMKDDMKSMKDYVEKTKNKNKNYISCI